MSRWIYIDDICIPSDENDWEELVAFADAIAEQEPIDIVRCSECKHWNEEDHWCNIRDSYGWDYKPDDFCSYGEREEEDIPMEYFENGGI